MQTAYKTSSHMVKVGIEVAEGTETRDMPTSELRRMDEVHLNNFILTE